MKLEQKVNSILRSNPLIKKSVKRVYQLGMYALSNKIKSEGRIYQVSPDDEYEYFFGYYDKSPWNMNENLMLCLRTYSTTKSVSPKEKAEVVLINLETEDIKIIGETVAWNVQQGAMLQWLGPDYDRFILYNDFRDGRYVSVMYDLETNSEKQFTVPVYNVADNGKFALTLDFNRLHELRPGYGYSNLSDKKITEPIPEGPAILKLNLESGQVENIIDYKDLYNFQTRPEMNGAFHKVNHIMINPSASRFMVLHRWIKNKTYSRLLTLDIDGDNIYNLSDDDMVSHSYWLNNDTIISYLHKNITGNGYYVLKDKTFSYKQVFKNIKGVGDGHPSISPNGKYIITDTYPDRKRIQHLYLSEIQSEDINNPIEIAKFYAPFRYDNELRCDLHPKWDRSSQKVSVDATFDGKRKLYIVKIK